MALFEAFLQFFEPFTFYLATVLFILCFIIWEVPRSLKVMSEEYSKGVYPEMGRVFDILLMFAGLGSIVFLYFIGGINEVNYFLRHEALMPIFAIVLIAIPLLVFMGYLKRFVGRIDKHDSFTTFCVHNFLDFTHTLFFISFSFLFITTLIYLIFGGL